RRVPHGAVVRCPRTGRPARPLAHRRRREVLARHTGPSRVARDRQASPLARLSGPSRRDPGNAESRGTPASGLSAGQSGSAARSPSGGGDAMTPQQFYLVCFGIGFVLSILGAFGGTFHWPFPGGAHSWHGFHLPRLHDTGHGGGGISPYNFAT